MPRTITTLQMMQLDLLRSVHLEGFDAGRIIADLTTHKDLWDAVLMAPDPNWYLLSLRDLPKNRWSVDCLYILAAEEHHQALNELVAGWHTTELMWLDAADSQAALRLPEKTEQRVLRLFW
jgi:hypothetical protein